MIGTSHRNDYSGNDSTAVYSYTFKIFAATDLDVRKRSATDSVDVVLSYPGDFSVTGVGLAAGGTVTLSAGVLPTGTVLTIRRIRPLSQVTEIRNQAQFLPDVIENTFDILTMIDQQQQDTLDRCLRLRDTVDPDTVDVRLPVPVANQAIVYNNSASGFTTVPTTGITIANFTSKIRIADVFAGATGGEKIMAAHNDLPAGGGTVDARGLEGAQSIVNTLVFTKPTLLLVGSSTFTYSGLTAIIRLQATGSGVEGMSALRSKFIGPANVDGVVIEADDCEIRRIQLYGPGGSHSGYIGIDSGGRARALIEECIIDNWGSHGINGGGLSDYWRVLNNIIRNNTDDGILTGTGTGWLIKGNQVYSNGSNGIDINGPRNRVLDNIVYSNGGVYVGSGLDCDGILVTSIGMAVEGVIISRNVVRANSCVGIRLRSDESRSTNNVTISFNIVSAHAGAAGYGILLDTSVGATCGTVNDAQIIGNQVYGNNKEGILVGGGAGAPCVVNRLKVADNTVTGNTGVGIFIAYGSDAVVSNNVSISNTGGNLSIVGSTRTADLFNKLNATDNVIGFNGTLAVGTIQPYAAGGAQVIVTSAGNTQLTITSSGVGRQPYSFIVDQFGKLLVYDDTAAAVRLSIDSAGLVLISKTLGISALGTLVIGATAFAGLGTPGNGTFVYCNDCTIASPCAGGGAGALAKRLGGAWVCN